MGFLHLHLFNDPEPIQTIKLKARAVDDNLYIAATDGVDFAMPNLDLFSG